MASVLPGGTLSTACFYLSSMACGMLYKTYSNSYYCGKCRFGGKKQRKGAQDRQISIQEYSAEHTDIDTCSYYPIEWQPEMKLLGYADA